jgi:putative oxidoreductase
MERYPGWALTVVRLILGIIFFAHGAQKVLGAFGGPGLAGTVGFMTQSGIPAPLAYAAAFTEFLGGICLILGVLSRFWAAGLTIVMLVAIAKVHFANGFFAPKGFEYPLALIGLSLAVIIGGPGRAAIADWETKVLSKKS